MVTGLGIVVAAIVAFAHWPALRAEALSFDDGQYLANNPLVQRPSWSSARRFCREVLEPSTVRGYYQPLAMISLMLDYAAGGRIDNLRPFHRTSLALHVANTVLVMGLLYALFGRPWIAAGVALLFGVHPMTVEPIPWVGERKTLLAAFFALLCLLAYVRYTRKRGWRPYVACTILYGLALLSKPTTIPLPVVLLLMDIWPLNRLSRRGVLEKVPLLGIGCVFAVITVISQGRTAGVEMPGEHTSRTIPLIVCHDILFYVCKTLWPTNLTSHYPVPQPLTLSNPAVVTAVVASFALVVLLAVSWRWTKALMIGWLICMIALLPTMGIIGFTNVLTSDKYFYLPSAGYLLIVAWLLEGLAGRPAKGRTAWRPAAVGLGVVAVASLLTFGTRQYLREWQTSERLSSYMLDLAPNSPSLHLQCGDALRNKGEYGRSIPHYTKTIALAPDYEMAYNNRGIAYAAIGEYDRAIQDYCRAIELDPNHAMAHNNRGIAYAAIRKFDQAIEDYATAIAMKPGYAEAYHNRGNARAEMHDYAGAIRDYTRAIELKPDFEQAHNNRGNAYKETKDYDLAIRDYNKAVELKPDFAEAYVNRGDAYRAMRDSDRAVRDYTKAIESRPDFEPAYTHRGHTYSEMRDYERAVSDYTRAIELKPDHAEAYNNRGGAYAQAGKFVPGIRDFTKAIQLRPDYAKAYYNRALAHYAIKDYDQAWADVRMCEQAGGEVNPDFIRVLPQTSSRPN